MNARINFVTKRNTSFMMYIQVSKVYCLHKDQILFLFQVSILHVMWFSWGKKWELFLHIDTSSYPDFNVWQLSRWNTFPTDTWGFCDKATMKSLTKLTGVISTFQSTIGAILELKKFWIINKLASNGFQLPFPVAHDKLPVRHIGIASGLSLADFN